MTAEEREAHAAFVALWDPYEGQLLRHPEKGYVVAFYKKSISGKTWRVKHHGQFAASYQRDWIRPEDGWVPA